MPASSGTPRSADPVSPTSVEPMQLVHETTGQPLNLPDNDDSNPVSPTSNEFNTGVQPSLSLRSIVTTKEAGVVIGKSGKNVSDIRERSGAKITISEMVQGAFERILIVSGPLDTVAKAYSLIARKILEEASENNQTSISMRTTAVRLLVPNNRMGSVIGKGGSKIKEIQEASGARLVASEEMLQGSTERTITVAGVPDSVHIAVYHVGLILQQHSERSAGTIPYKPTAKFGGGGGGGHGSAPFAGAPSIDPYAPPAGFGGQYPPQGGPGPYQGGGAGGPPPRNPPGSGPSQQGSQAQQIFIPNDMVGCIIGKNGSKINEIRHLSGSHIKIGEPHGNNNERLVTITGTPDANQMALYLLYSRLEAEKGRMAANN